MSLLETSSLREAFIQRNTVLIYQEILFSYFSSYRLADELAEAAVELRNHLGEALMPLEKYYLLSRGVFEIGKVTVASGQYFQEIPYYGPPRPCEGEQLEITKFYEWKIIDCPRVCLVYSIHYCNHLYNIC